MANPVVVEATRGALVESAHRGAGAVVDADGRVVMAFGDADRPVYPRSAVKALQALPLVASGAADRLGLSDKEIALSCASHSGSEDHVATARAMLAKAGYDERALECGAHWPLGENEARALARSGRTPTALHNNCSGKHAGFICLSCAMGVDPKGYVAPDHAVQREVKASIEADDRRVLKRGDARRRWLQHPDLRHSAGRARARLRAAGDRPRTVVGTRQRLGAHPRRRRRASFDRRGKGPFRHGSDEPAWAARLHQVGRRGRILRRAAGSRSWPRGQGGRWGRARGASDDCGAHPPFRRLRRRDRARASCASSRRASRTGTAPKSGSCVPRVRWRRSPP